MRGLTGTELHLSCNPEQEDPSIYPDDPWAIPQIGNPDSLQEKPGTPLLAHRHAALQTSQAGREAPLHSRKLTASFMP